MFGGDGERWFRGYPLGAVLDAIGDGWWLLAWGVVLCGGLVAVVVFHHLGLASTYSRDLLHVGTGVWVVGWPFWHSPVVPVTLTLVAAAATAVVPLLGRRLAFAQRFEHSVSGGGETWTGLVWYTLAYALFTWLGLTRTPFAAGAALLALSLGDGLGGVIGRLVGKHGYEVPWAKRKTFEGTLAVAVMAAVGAALAGWWLGSGADLRVAVGLGAVAGIAEAVSPRASDNMVVPAAVWVAAMLMS